MCSHMMKNRLKIAVFNIQKGKLDEPKSSGHCIDINATPNNLSFLPFVIEFKELYFLNIICHAVSNLGPRAWIVKFFGVSA